MLWEAYLFLNNHIFYIYSKPTFLHGDFSLRFTWQNRFAATTFRDQEKIMYIKLYTPKRFDSWFVERKFRVDKALVNLVKFSRTRIKVGDMTYPW